MWIRRLAATVLGLLALHSATYGLGFLADPAQGAREFGIDAPATEAAARLAGLVGIILILLASYCILSAIAWLRHHPAGPWTTLAIGTSLLPIAAYWAIADLAWDAGFYAAFGLLLIGLATTAIRRERTPHTTTHRIE